MKLDHILTPNSRINSKWIKDLNVGPKTIKIIEKNIGSKISDIAQSNILLDISPQQGKKEKKNKWDYIKLKSFCTAKEVINKIKIQPTEWESIFANTSDKGLISKLYKEVTKLNTETKQTTQLKMGKGPEQALLQKGHTPGQQTYEKMLNVSNHQRNAN